MMKRKRKRKRMTMRKMRKKKKTKTKNMYTNKRWFKEKIMRLCIMEPNKHSNGNDLISLTESMQIQCT
jgi:hypothetical protein